MGKLIGNIISLLWWMLIGLPPRLMTLFALMWLGLILWLHRKRHSHSGLTGAETASIILSKRKLRTKVVAVEDMLADCYLPRHDTIVLSEHTFHGTSIGAISVAAHEVGHAIQRKRWFAPWCMRRLLAWPASLGLALCLWVWLIGMVLENQQILLTAVGCFGAYMLFLLFELICEVDASRRAVRELIRHGILDAAESRIARRILRSAFVTYIAFFVGSGLAMAFFLSCLDWTSLLHHFPLLSEQLPSVLP